MPRNDDQLRTILLEQLTDCELDHCVVYLLSTPVAAGTTLEFPHFSLFVPWEACLAFVDREPLANWGHSCRYILIDPNSSESRSIEARFPPFRPNDSQRWRVIYRAPALPDNVPEAPG